jgi:hypothetical protein
MRTMQETLQRRARSVTLLLCLAAPAIATTGQQAAPAAAPASENITTPFSGDWVGVLEYRDFQTDARVQLPTWLSIRPGTAPNSLAFTYTYDDGPNKTVVERSTVTMDQHSSTYTVTSDRDHSSDTYKIAEGLDSFTASHRGKLTLTGTGTENDKKVDVRITITLGRNLYKFVKETRLPGQDFLFRDGYTFTRRDPPPSSPKP